jgi:streptogramin lyase
MTRKILTRKGWLIALLLLIVPAVPISQSAQAPTLREISLRGGGTGDIGDPEAVAVDGTFVWAARQFTNTLTRLRASDGGGQAQFSLGKGKQPIAVTFDGTNIWVANLRSNTVMRVRPIDGHLLG